MRLSSDGGDDESAGRSGGASTLGSHRFPDGDPMTATPTVPAPFSRRSLLLATGLSVAALGGLAACGMEAPAPEGAPGPQTAATGDIPVGGGTIFPGSETVITQPAAGEFKAFSSICTHAQCDVADVTTTINCTACHGSEFSITDGSVVKQPAPSPLAPKTIKVDGDTITVT